MNTAPLGLNGPRKSSVGHVGHVAKSQRVGEVIVLRGPPVRPPSRRRSSSPPHQVVRVYLSDVITSPLMRSRLALTNRRANAPPCRFQRSVGSPNKTNYLRETSPSSFNPPPPAAPTKRRDAQTRGRRASSQAARLLISVHHTSKFNDVAVAAPVEVLACFVLFFPRNPSRKVSRCELLLFWAPALFREVYRGSPSFCSPRGGIASLTAALVLICLLLP